MSAARLAREFLHTGRRIPGMAFERHIGGMLLLMREGRA